MKTKKTKYKKGDRQLYENVFDGLSYYPTVGETYHLHRSKSKVWRFYSQAIEKSSSPKVLDIGCHIGTDLFMLPKTNPTVKYWGVDISKEAISYARILAAKRGEKNIFFKTADANKPLPFPAGYFDVVMAMELIEHLHDPLTFLLEAKRVLRPGGSLIITTPNESRIVNTLIQLLPASLRHHYDTSREQDFTRHGPAFHLNSDVWDHEAHISLKGFSQWRQLFSRANFSLSQVEGSSVYGGSRVIGDHPFLLGLAILTDSILDRLPLKPYLQLCLIVNLIKK